MLCDSNSTSLMSIDNNSSSEPIKKFSPVKLISTSWWEEVEAAEQIGFHDTDTDITVKSEQNKQTDDQIDPNKATITTTMDPEKLTFANKIKVEELNEDDDLDYKFLDRTIESNDSTVSSSREMTFEFLESSNETKYDRFAKVKTPFKRRFSSESRSNSPISFLATDKKEVDETFELKTIKTENDCLESTASSSMTLSSGRGHGKRRRINQPLETNAEILTRRQKQIDYGKNTIGYDNYIKQIPRNQRTKEDPWTPPKQFKYSRRAFDGLIKIWRTKLHCFDSPTVNRSNDDLNADNPDDCDFEVDTSSDDDYDAGNEDK